MDEVIEDDGIFSKCYSSLKSLTVSEKKNVGIMQLKSPRKAKSYKECGSNCWSFIQSKLNIQGKNSVRGYDLLFNKVYESIQAENSGGY